jgi:hypothetical protein
MIWAGNVACMGDKQGAYRVLVWRPEGKKPLGRPRCTWDDNIKTDLHDVGWDSFERGNELFSRIKCREYLD